MTDTSDLDDAIKDSIHHPLDPHFYYDARAKILESEAVGVERLLYKILGRDLISSFAFAIDPFHSFRRIPKVDGSRLRTRYRDSVLHGRKTRSYHTLKRSRTRSTYRIPGSGYPGTYSDLAGDWVTKVDATASLPPQMSVPDFCTDTTNSSRLKGSIGGPLEKFEYSLRSPEVTRTKKYHSLYAYVPGPTSDSDVVETLDVIGAAAYMELSDIQSIISREQADASFALQDNSLPLLARCTPTSKMFGLSRSIGELKDFKHLGKLSTYAEATRRRAATWKDTPDLFLSLEFGLAPLISDIQRLVKLPALVSARLNKLLARTGKPTSYRSKFKLSSDFGSPPAFKFFNDGLSYDGTTGTTASRKREVRMAVNSTFEFPPVELPQLRRELSAKLYGADIDAKTLYDLVPWTWLIDWFTGFGDYLNVIEEINTDPSLVNYGFITYASEGHLASQYSYKVDDVTDLTYRVPDSHSVITVAKTVNQYGYLNWSYQLRKSVADLGVSTVSGEKNLSTFQALILSALTAQRAH